MIEAVSTSETSVNFHETTRRSIPEGCRHTRRRENLKSHTVEKVACKKCEGYSVNYLKA
jgi:hypothetical protein